MTPTLSKHFSIFNRTKPENNCIITQYSSCSSISERNLNQTKIKLPMSEDPSYSLTLVCQIPQKIIIIEYNFIYSKTCMK